MSETITIPDLTPVKSNNIKAVGYWGPGRLFVQFNGSNAIWMYEPVAELIYNELLAAPSIGSYFHKWIRQNAAYKARQVKAGDAPPARA